jgi:alpha-glucoside transport system substrate-binding protein
MGTSRASTGVGARCAAGGGHRRISVLLVGMLLVACGPGPAANRSSVQVLGSWTGREADIFQRVLQPFEVRTGIRVDYTMTRDLRGAIAQAIVDGHPPDLAGLEGPTHLQELAAQGALHDIGDAIDLQRYKASVPPAFVEFGSINSRLVGVFLKATVKGLVWYDPKVFRRGTPSTYADLQVLSEPYLKDGTRQWCVGLASKESSGWPGTDLVETFLIHQSGVEAYDRWTAGDLAWTSDEVRSAFEAYGRIVADDAVFGGPAGALKTDFDAAGDPLFTRPPGCLFLHQASFMPAFFETDGHRAGIDFDFFPFPALQGEQRGSVIGGGDLFGLLTDNPAAAQLLAYLVSPEAQSVLVTAGGALSVDRRVTGYPNDLVRREAALLTGATHFRFDASDLMPAAMNEAFWQAILDFTADQGRLDQILDRLEHVRQGLP